MRSKEEAHDYRYFPEPDLVPIILDKAYIQKLKVELPELPSAKQARFVNDFGLTPYDAGVLTSEQELAEWFEVGTKATKNPKGFANWMMGDMAAQMKEQEKELKDLKFDQKKLAELVELIDAGTINSKQAKEVFLELFNNGTSPAEVVKSKGMAQVSDPQVIEDIVFKVLVENYVAVDGFKCGKQGVVGFLVGKVMQVSQGKANPKLVNDVLKKTLENLRQAALKVENHQSLERNVWVFNLILEGDGDLEGLFISGQKLNKIKVIPTSLTLGPKNFNFMEWSGRTRRVTSTDEPWVFEIGDPVDL